MIETSKYAVKLAVLRFPEAFGLKDEEVNPLLAYTLIMAEAHEEIIDHESILEDFVVECEKTVELTSCSPNLVQGYHRRPLKSLTAQILGILNPM